MIISLWVNFWERYRETSDRDLFSRNSQVKIRADWDLPVLPRIGECISSSLITALYDKRLKTVEGHQEYEDLTIDQRETIEDDHEFEIWYVEYELSPADNTIIEPSIWFTPPSTWSLQSET